MSQRWLGSLCMLSLVALYALLGRDWPAAAILAPVAILPALLSWRGELGTLAQAMLSCALLGLAALLAKVLPGPQLSFGGAMGPLVPFLAMGSILLASHRFFLREPAGGDRATVAHGFWCLVACGSQRAGLLYVGGCALYLLLAGAWLRGGRPWALGKHRGWWVLTMTLSATLAGGLAWVIPRAHSRVLGWLLDASAEVGFHDGPLVLGSMAGLADSDRVVARVFRLTGSPLLRGIAYQDYGRGRWLSRSSTFSRATVVSGGGGEVEVRYETIDMARYFVPLDARDIAINSQSALIDGFGVLSPVYGSSPQWARYTPGARDAFVPNPPDPADLVVPENQRAALTRQALRLAGDATAVEERLARLQAGLIREHRYSLDFKRPPRRDPVVAFLEEEGSGGHCEYFASAMALLARSVGIPARVVGGYRVSEFNDVGKYHVVRERNAHAWVEAHVPGKGWVSVDATPADSFAVSGPEHTPLLSAWLDAALTVGSGLVRQALEHPAQVSVLLLPIVAFILLRDVWRRWRASRGAGGARPFDALEPPSPYLTALLAALERGGVARGPAESLEALARRLDEARPGDEAAALLRRYAALRYGGVGSEGEVRAEFERYLGAQAAR